MAKIYVLVILCLNGCIFLRSRWLRWVRQVWREKGDLVFKKRKRTLFDVRHLLIKGEKGLAVRLYRELFKTSMEEAFIAVDAVERSLQPMDFEY